MDFMSLSAVNEVGSLVKEVMAVWENVRSHRKNGKVLSETVNIVYEAMKSRSYQGSDLEKLAIRQFQSIMKRAIVVADKCNQSTEYRLMSANSISAEITQIQAELLSFRLTFLVVREAERGGQPPSPSQKTNLLGTQSDPNAQVETLKQEIKDKAEAQFRLALQYANGNGVPKDMEQAVQFYRRAAKNGHRDAQYNLGVCYTDGEGVPEDMEQAVQFFRRAEENGHRDAQNYLGWCYANGEGVPKDMEQAVQFYRRAAENGHPAAHCNLAMLYMTGKGVIWDMNRAVELFQKAADQGGAIFQKDMERLVQHPHALAAENGDSNAQGCLGMLYMTGSFVTRDMNRAVELFQKAADQGDDDAQFLLGVIFADGNGIIQKDMVRAVRMLIKAADQSHAEAANMLRRLTVGTEDQGRSV